MSFLPHRETVLKEVKEVKSLFASKTFLAVCFTAIASLAPLIGVAIKENRLSVDNAVQIVLVLAGAGTAIVGRAAANDSLVYTPNGLPGINKEDVLPVPEAQQGDRIEGTINESGIASVSEQVPDVTKYLDPQDLMRDAMDADYGDREQRL